MSKMQTPKIGDLIEIDRKSYQHWAVYIGKNKVVHLVQVTDEVSKAGGIAQFSSCYSAPKSGNISGGRSLSKPKATVKIEKLDTVVNGDEWIINNYLDGKHKPRPPKNIVDDVHNMVGDEMDYDLLKWNCEHFAIKLRYGIAKSKQAEAAEDVADAVGIGAIVLGVGALAISLIR